MNPARGIGEERTNDLLGSRSNAVPQIPGSQDALPHDDLSKPRIRIVVRFGEGESGFPRVMKQAQRPQIGSIIDEKWRSRGVIAFLGIWGNP